MQEVEPFRTKEELVSAIDNGGRFYNLFSRAHDQIVTRGELAKAAGVWASDLNAFLFLDLASFQFDERDKKAVVSLLEPDLRDRYQEMAPTVLRPSLVDQEGKAGDAVIVEGVLQQCHDKTQFSGCVYTPIMIGDVTTYTLTPIFNSFTVYKVFDEEGSEPCAVIAAPLHSGFVDGDEIRFAGYLRELEFEEEEYRTNKFYLEPTFFSNIAN